MYLFGPLSVPPHPHEEVEQELDDLEQHHEGHAQEETQSASQPGKEAINLWWNKRYALATESHTSMLSYSQSISFPV